MKNKNILTNIILMIILTNKVQAFPIPQVIGGVIGIGELFIMFVGLLFLYLPFLKKENKNTLIIGLSLLISLILNFYLMLPEKDINNKEERPGMLWEEEERQNDVNGINEKKAYEILKSNNSEYVFIDFRTNAEKELGNPVGFLDYKFADVINNREKFKNKKIIGTCWTGMRGSEICAKLREYGFDCQYLKGGIKKWMELGLPVKIIGEKENFGSIPWFENVEKY